MTDFTYKWSIVSENSIRLELTNKIPFLNVYGDINLVGHMIKSNKARRIHIIKTYQHVLQNIYRQQFVSPFTNCLSLWEFSSHSRNFHSHEGVTIADEGLQILTILARHSWSFSSEGSFFSVPHLLWHWSSVYNGHQQLSKCLLTKIDIIGTG